MFLPIELLETMNLKGTKSEIEEKHAQTASKILSDGTHTLKQIYINDCQYEHVYIISYWMSVSERQYNRNYQEICNYKQAHARENKSNTS